ncbi:MAG: hypothetical protein WBX03_09370 [Terriglobales bacterium]
MARIVFVGGCATGLLLTDPAAAPVRATLDVDVVVELASYAEYIALEEQLRRLGFQECQDEGAPICRWVSDDIVLDVMPTDSSLLGFSNRWYRAAFENAQKVSVAGHEIGLITAPYFLATKLEAFHGRGKEDYRGSRDLEDVITVLDGRPEIEDEVALAPPDFQQYLSDEFRALTLNRDFLDALPEHLLPDPASQQRIGIVLERMKNLIWGV